MMEGKGKIALIGSGQIGRAWAVLFCKAGYHVCLYDISESQLESSLKGIRTMLQQIQDQGLLDNGFVIDKCIKLVSTTTDLSEALKGAMFLQESIPENVHMKKDLFKTLDQLVSDDVILSSSSSCLYPSLFTSDLVHRKQCIVSHPVNPPCLHPLVEIVTAPYTDEKFADQTTVLMKDIGQVPIRVKKEVNGFVLNRLQYALLMEAWRLVEDGVCSPEDIDTTFTQGLGMRYALIGPFEAIHLNAPNGVKDYCERYGANIEVVCRSQESTRAWSGATMETIHEAMCKNIPLESLDERRALRDKRLASLALHRKNTEKK